MHGYAPALGWGAADGFAWWIIGGLVLMPVLLGMPAFAPLMMPPMRMVAMGSFVGHLIYGGILGLRLRGSTQACAIARHSTPDHTSPVTVRLMRVE